MKGCLLMKVSSRSVLASTLLYYYVSINSTFASFVTSPLVSRTIASTSFIPSSSSLSLQHNLSCTRSSNKKSKNFMISTSNKSNIHIHNKSLTSLAQKKDDIMEESKTEAQHKIDPLSALNLPSPLILGSGSFTRKLILQEMNIPFVLKVKPINEYEIGIRENETYAKELVMTLAKAKADALIQGIIDTNSNNNNNGTLDEEKEEQKDDKFNLNLPNYSSTNEYVVLTADQVVTCNNQILEKPNSIDEAQTFVKQYANNPPKTVGSVVLTHLPSMKQVSGIDISTIYFKSQIEKDCEALVANLLSDNAPILSCAGGLMVEHKFVKEYIVNIDGSEDGVMGLSKALVSRLLNELKNKLDSL